MEKFTVKNLSQHAGVSVRTLHLYDKSGLLLPSIRTEAGYRYYGKSELLRLQQILFYKELGFSLKQIKEILDDAGFNLVDALENHKSALLQKQENISVLLGTIDKTIVQLKKGKVMLKPEELYEGFPKDKTEEYRREASNKFGNESVKRSEDYLRSLKKEDLKELKHALNEVFEKLFASKFQDPESDKVQELIHEHYLIIRQFWGTYNLADKQYDAYAGLGDLYLSDDQFTMMNDQAQPQFASFLNNAMKIYAKRKLKKY